MHTLFVLILLFIGLPLLELGILFHVSDFIGAFNTFALVILTGVLGAGLARWQGISVLRRIRSEMQRGSVPAAELADGFLIFSAGLVLITPGLITDTVGFLLLIPPVRATIRRALVGSLRKRFSGRADVHFVNPQQATRDTKPQDNVIEVTAKDVTDE
ncbi:MAG: FxsA family protein [Candidatus Pacebacteria bacterium]|nr:FxsA family protein [Candidatus Paceibacterota bacterium]